MRRAARVDDNHEEIVRALRAVGVWVHSTAALGDGFPDLLVYFHGFALLELKDPQRPPYQRRLNPAQQAFAATCPGPCFRVETAAEAFRALGVHVAPNGAVSARGTAANPHGTSEAKPTRRGPAPRTQHKQEGQP